MEKINIDIKCLDGTIWNIKKAEVIGDLAIHQRRFDQLWTITHIPTLLTFDSIIPAKLKKNEDKLKKWAGLIQTKLKKDWAQMRELKGDDVMKWPDKSKALRGRIRKMAIRTNGG